MKTRNKQIAESITLGSQSSTLLIVGKDKEELLNFIRSITKRIIDLKNDKPLHYHHDVIGIWEDQLDTRSIRIEQIHEFIRKIQFRPYFSRNKVGIITAAEKMTKEAQNALLKTLEEPPQNTLLILTSSSASNLLDTVTSRCKIIDISENKEDKINHTTITNILKANIVERFEIVEEIIKKKNKAKVGEEIDKLLFDLTSYFRKLLLSNLKKEKKVDQIKSVIDLIELTIVAVSKNVNTRLALENLMINLPVLQKE